MLQNGTFRLGDKEKLQKSFAKGQFFLTKSLVTISIILTFVTENEPKTAFCIKRPISAEMQLRMAIEELEVTSSLSGGRQR